MRGKRGYPWDEPKTEELPQDKIINRQPEKKEGKHMSGLSFLFYYL